MKYRDPGTPFIMAILVVPIVACVVFEVADQFVRRAPGATFSDNIAYSLVGACTLIGVALIQFNDSWSVRRRIITAVVYFPLMYMFVMFVTSIYMVLRGVVPLATHQEMPSNNALERTANRRGPPLGAHEMVRPALARRPVAGRSTKSLAGSQI